MATDPTLLDQIIFLIGEITLIVIAGIFFFAVLMVVLAWLSIRRGKIYFPSFLKAGMVLVEGLARALFKLFGLEDNQVHAFFIQLHNTLNKKAFEAVPVSEAAPSVNSAPASPVTVSRLSPMVRSPSCAIRPLRTSMPESAVTLTAAIGVPHEIKGNAIHAYVIVMASESTPTMTLDSMLFCCRDCGCLRNLL